MGKYLDLAKTLPLRPIAPKIQSGSPEIQLGPLVIAIAIDRGTGSALLLFKESDSEIVRDVADVHRKPFEVWLTPAQRNEIRDSLEYLNQINSRKGTA